MEITPKLKQKITERWNIITDGQMFNPLPQGQKNTAFAQLEYILIEAGLLAQRRARLSERIMAEADKLQQQPAQTAQTEITL